MICKDTLIDSFIEKAWESTVIFVSVFYVETILRTFIPTKETYTRFLKIHLKTKVQLVAELNAVFRRFTKYSL